MDLRCRRPAEPRRCGGADGPHALRNGLSGLFFHGRCRIRLLRYGGRGGPHRAQGRHAHPSAGRRRSAHGHRRRFGAPDGLCRQPFGGALPRVGRPAGAAESQRRPSAPHPRSRRRLARHRVGDLRRDGNHALQPRDGRLQAFRTAALHRFLQHRHPDQDRRGRRTAVDQDEQLGIRLLRPRARRGQTLLQRSPAAQLPDDQRRRALRRARRRAVALDLPRTRAAQGGDPAPARRGLHPRLEIPESAFGRDPRADDRQPGPEVGRHARRRADRFRRREQTRLHAACAGPPGYGHDLRPEGGLLGQHLGRHQGRGSTA